MKTWIYAVMVVAAGAIVGCDDGSSSTKSSGGDGGSGGSSSGGNGGAGGSSMTTTTSNTTTSSSTTSSTSSTMSDPCADLSDCTACPDGDTCTTCCDDGNPDALGALITGLVTQCACQDMSACKDVCAPAMAGDPDICADPLGQTTQECVTCINTEVMNQGACVGATVNACVGDPNCSPILECYQGCPQ